MKVYYINLDHRTDRRQHIEKELEYFECEKIRIPGCEGRDIGCFLAHIKALNAFIESEEESCIIFEDDFMFIRDPKEFDFPKEPWDVVMLSSKVIKSVPHSENFEKVIEAQTLSGYAVHKNFAPVLLENFMEGINLLRKYGNPDAHMVDQYCKKIQPCSNWFVCSPKFGIQKPFFSDIELKYTDYGV